MQCCMENVRQRQQHRCQEISVKYFRGKFSHILQEIFVMIVKIVPAKIEFYHHYKQNRASLKSAYNMREVLLITSTGNFEFSILLPGREIYFLGLGNAFLYYEFL